LNERLKNLVVWLVMVLVVMSVLSSFGPKNENVVRLAFSEFVDKYHAGEVKKVSIENQYVMGQLQDDRPFASYVPYKDTRDLVNDLIKSNVLVWGKSEEQPSLLMNIFVSWFPMILFVGVWIFFMRQMQGGGGGRGAMSFGRSRARLLGEDQVKVTFADVAGVDEAKEEVAELVEFLRDPGKFQSLGGRIPRGVLMVGQPGTGKTLLAKAIAGEAKVPFFSISGSDFVEMFVGVGASRVRDMFEQAKKHAPCIIFIDEIDAVGRNRGGAGMGGGHDEREQTLNQLLVEMDGFEGNEGVIVIAATNRPDVLDPALLRPGRFDRQVSVSLPDIRGREQILLVHMRKLPVSDNIQPRVIARGTPGFSGADLANLVNEAALFAARSNKRLVAMEEFEKAKDKILMGVERRSMIMGERERRMTAYHEAGHAIVGLTVLEHDPVYKVTIIPRARALGVTLFLPEDDRYSYSMQRLESKVASFFGGRVAEELVFGKNSVTTGASDDIRRATDIARNMVTRWGLSERLGPLTYGEEEEDNFHGYSGNKRKEMSDETAHVIDEEIRKIIDKNYQLAKQILIDNMDKLHLMSEALLKYETIDAAQIQDIMQGRPPREPEGWNDNDKPNSNGKVANEESKDVVKETSSSTGPISAVLSSSEALGDPTNPPA